MQYILWIQRQKLELVSQFTDSEKASQAQIDMERWKVSRTNRISESPSQRATRKLTREQQLRANLGCPDTAE